jgi:hypothetical protein
VRAGGAAGGGLPPHDADTEDVFIVTNNHYQGKAVANALMLKSMVEKKKVPAPEPLFARYGEVLRDYAVPRPPLEH